MALLYPPPSVSSPSRISLIYNHTDFSQKITFHCSLVAQKRVDILPYITKYCTGDKVRFQVHNGLLTCQQYECYYTSFSSASFSSSVFTLGCCAWLPPSVDSKVTPSSTLLPLQAFQHRNRNDYQGNLNVTRTNLDNEHFGFSSERWAVVSIKVSTIMISSYKNAKSGSMYSIS